MKKFKEMVIVIAEDDDGHVELITSGLKSAGVLNRIIRFSNGEEVMQFFSGESENFIYDEAKSYLLLLDINMPIVDGVEVLKRLKDEEELKKIPVIMLTTTDDPREIERCYQLGCNVYITKPVNFASFAETLNRLGLFVQIVSV